MDLSTTYKDDSSRSLIGMSVGNIEESYESDFLGRNKEIIQTLNYKTYGKRYGYYKNGDHATNRVNAISYTRDGQTDGKVMYTYDSMGNVISVNVNGKQVEKFSYDKLGRLIFEENLDKNRKICYTYDENGNILTKSVNGEVTVYKYRPKTNFLMAFGDETFAYDGMGNPTTYRGMDCTWIRGRCLNSVSVGGKKAYYGYDESGLRKTKKIYAQSTADEPDETIQFVYENDKLLRQKNGDETIDFIYGSEGIIGFKVGNSNYLYRKNLFGDVIEIYNDESALVGKYSYTAFGVCTVELDDGGIATKNPIRYRSYYYDDETELYYLKSRYYDPEVGRFITIDDISYLDPESINGLNLYAYCGNNPVMFIDETGKAPKWWQSILIGVGIIVGAAIIATAISFTGGGAAAFFIAAGKVILGGIKVAVTVGIGSGIIRAGKTVITGGTINEVGQSFVLGFADGFLAGSIYAGGSMLLSAGVYKISGLFNKGYGWSIGKLMGGYQTPQTPGISIITYKGGVNGGRRE